MLSKLFLIILYKVHPRSCTHAFVITSRCVSWAIWMYVLFFTARSGLGLVGDADYPPINFPPAFWVGWHIPISGFLFYRVCSPKPWPFGKILRSPLRSWWFHLSCFIPKKWKMLQGCRKIWLRFPRKPALRFYPKLLALSSLVARSFRSFNHADLATASLYYLCKGDLMFLEGLIFYCGQCCGKSSPCLPFFYLWQRRSLWDGLTSFRRYFLCRSISFYSIE